MNAQTVAASRFHYQVESKPVAHGGRAWSVFESRAEGGRTVLASGTVYPQPGESWGHEELVSFVQSAARCSVG